ncbi:MAG TPA: sugar transferase [Vicinamibacterales bacterium]|nr:sugar transferase [Vicinamibacterales bacterium]
MSYGWYGRWGKPALDIGISLPLLVVVSPVILLLAGLVRVFLGSPVLFRQERPGLRGKPFVLLKFRSMRIERDGTGGLRPDADRMTTFGRLLRRTSLDELPELWNVLRGDMSLVGPRPLLMDYLARYSPEQARRHEVRPGITGWAQVNGRNALAWEPRFALDVWYVDHMSLWLDVRIIGLTLWKTLFGEGISAPGHATMDEFQGSKSDTDGSTRGAP